MVRRAMRRLMSQVRWRKAAGKVLPQNLIKEPGRAWANEIYGISLLGA
jgi:DnaJ-domain-containing protein 1